jgi:hypothetical protein
MIDCETHQPIHVNQDGDAGPYLMIPVQQIDEVSRVLRDHDVPFSIARDAVSLDGQEVIAVLDFGLDANAQAIQSILDSRG